MAALNYNHLYYFYRVATDGSITRASERLHLTPQTISGQISTLEDQLGIDLFQRKGKKLYLTEMGRQVYSYTEEIFQLGEELSHFLKIRSVQPELHQQPIEFLELYHLHIQDQ